MIYMMMLMRKCPLYTKAMHKRRTNPNNIGAHTINQSIHPSIDRCIDSSIPGGQKSKRPRRGDRQKPTKISLRKAGGGARDFGLIGHHDPKLIRTQARASCRTYTPKIFELLSHVSRSPNLARKRNLNGNGSVTLRRTRVESSQSFHCDRLCSCKLHV